jgi:predicted nucleic acid-binding protein
MTSTLVDTNIFIDLLGPATAHRVWSVGALETCLNEGPVVLSAIVWSELAASPLSEAQLTAALGYLAPIRETVSLDVAFVAGKAHRRYRMSGGARERTLPDFLIGAQALVGKHRLLTRDGARYERYFPGLPLITPDTHP